MTQPSPQADREAFLARARAVGEEGNWFVHETPYGFDWKNPDEEKFVRVRLNEDRHEFRTVETVGGRGGGWSMQRHFAITLGPNGLKGTRWSAVNPRDVVTMIGRELGWTEKVPGAVLFAAAMAALALGGLVIGGLVVFVLWALGRLPA